MAVQDDATLKGYFETGDTPTEAQFADLIDSKARVDNDSLTDIGCRLYHSSSVSRNDSEQTAMPFDSESWDTDGMHNTSTNNERITAQTAGKYLVFGNVQFSIDADGDRAVKVLKNGATNIGYVQQGPANGSTFVPFTVIAELSVGDYLEIIPVHSAGNALDITVNGTNSFVAAQRIG